MTMTLPLWAIPALLTVGLWAWGILMPVPNSRGDYDFGPMLTGLFRLVVCVVGTLVFWLIFFMMKSAI